MQLFISFITGIVLFYAFMYFPFLTGALVLLCFFVIVLKKKMLLILFLLTGIAFAFFRYEPVKDFPFVRDNVALQGVIQSYPTKTDNGMFRQSLRIDSAMNMKNGKTLHALAGHKIMLLSDRGFHPGTFCKITAKFLKKKTRLNPAARINNDQYAILLDLYNERVGEKNVKSTIQNHRYKLDRFITANFKKDSGDFLKAITLGQKAEIDYELRNAFNKAGLAHILSISGTHFGLFSLLIFGLFKFLIKYLPYRILLRITLYLTPSQVASLLCLPFMLAYLCLSGASIPAVRSFIIITLFMVGLIIGRKDFWITSLSFAAFVLILCDPDTIFSISFQLSFIAVLFIGFSISYTRHEQKVDKKFLRYVKNVLMITLSASIGTAPLVAYYFHYFSLISPISNLFIAPIVGFILIPLSVASAFLFLMTGHFLLAPIVSTVADVSILLVRWFSDIPFADVKIPAFPPIIILLFYAGFVFYLLSEKTIMDSLLKNEHKNIKGITIEKILSKQKRYFLLIPFIPILIYFSLSIFQRQELTITYLDVGQGDSSVIELSDGKTIVIDAGRSGRETSSFLKYRGKKTIDAIILSHVHSDHTGGLDYLIKRFKVKELWDNGRLIYPENYLSEPSANFRTEIKHRTLNRGDVVEGKGYSIYVFHPYPEFYTMYGSDHVEANNDSLVLKIKGRNNSFLFTGDIEEEAEEDIVHLGGWLKSDVIKVPHQGGKTSSYEPFFETVSPHVAVISVGRNNPFGHPHREMLEVLNGSKIFRTDLAGAIKISESEKGLEIKTYKDFQFTKADSFRDEIRNIKRLFETW